MPISPDDEIALSCKLAEFVVGDGSRPFSAICYERRFTSPWWFCMWRLVDRCFRSKRGEVGHCARVWRDCRDAALDDLERVRRAGW